MMRVIVKIGDLSIGAGDGIVPQTMCNTDTNDVESTTKQIIDLHRAGFPLVRVTVQGLREVESLREIKKRLLSQNIRVPIVADIHFSSETAIESAKIADKVRINPGNFAKDFDTAKQRLIELISVCKEHNTALRIGLNHGSLGERITNLYGNTPLAMKEALIEWMDICIEQGFDQVVFSLKASNTIVMSEAYQLFYNEMENRGKIFPLHLGVTEAGNGETGRIKSAVGIASLLKLSIGDTIRVSLTENPIMEYNPCRYIIDHFKNRNIFEKNGGERSNKTGSDQHFEIIERRESKKRYYSFSFDSMEEFIIRASCEIGPLLINHEIDDFEIEAMITGERVGSAILENYKDDLMQASRRKITKPEYIACPGCGRTLFDLEGTLARVKEKTSHLKGMTIAVMGCIVNGPGEMADADWGYIGEGKGKVSIYKGKNAIVRSVPEESAVDLLLELIEKGS